MTLFAINPISAKHKKLLHYTDFDTLKLILNNKTLQFSNLEILNDRHEAKRRGVEQFAKYVFVSCFSNYQHEVVPFWLNYGKGENESKVLLKITNFSNDFENCFFTDFYIAGETPLKRRAIEPAIQIIRLTDVLYRPITHRAFQGVYSGSAILRNRSNKQIQSTGTIYDLTTLGEYKTIHWKYERETRVICKMGLHHEPSYERMLLKLKEDFFRDMEIILNPWCGDDFAVKVSEYIKQVSLPEEIKNTINISKSELDGLLKKDV